MTISERIFEIMKDRGITQKEFSKRTGIPQSTISDWKGKRINPSADKIMTISDALGVQPIEILSGTESKDYHMPEYVMINRGSDEFLILEKYRKLDEGTKKRLMGYLDALSK